MPISGPTDPKWAAPATIIDVVARQGESYNDVMVVGHNPGMTDLANQLSDARVDNMPTCGVFAVEVDIKHWGGLVRKQGKFQYFDYPKKPD